VYVLLVTLISLFLSSLNRGNVYSFRVPPPFTAPYCVAIAAGGKTALYEKVAAASNISYQNSTIRQFFRVKLLKQVGDDFHGEEYKSSRF